MNGALLFRFKSTIMIHKFIQNARHRGVVSIKKVPALTLDEQTQLATIIKRYYPTAAPAYIHARTQIDLGFDVVLLKQGAQICGVSYYHLSRLSTPFGKKPIRVLHFGQAMKHETYKGNVIWRLGTKYARQQLGWAFPFVPALGVATIVTPRVFEKFQQLYPTAFFHTGQPHAREALAFLNHYFQVERGLDLAVDEDFCYPFPHIADDDITEDWTRFFKANDERINALFFEKGILVRRGGRIYKTPKHLVALGYRNWRQRHRLSVVRSFLPPTEVALRISA